MTTGPPDRNARMGRAGPFGGAGWVLALAAVIFVVVAWTQLRTVFDGTGRRGPGDGEHVDSYGFALDGLLVPRGRLVASGMARDTLEPLDHPPLMVAAAVDSLNAAERGKYLVDDDLVIGLELNGVARAYPTRVLNWHEVANDTLGGVPVLVTWQALCGSAVACDRRVDGDTLSFGHSGLLWNSNLLLYDRDRPEPSLWLQLQARAVAGPAAARGDSLRILPHELTSWRTWRAEHPATTVPFPAQDMRQSYKRDPYGAYEGSDLLRFPVAPLPPEDERRYKQRVVAVRRAGGWSRPRPAAPEDAGSGSLEHPTIHAYWFAWYAVREAPPLP